MLYRRGWVASRFARYSVLPLFTIVKEQPQHASMVDPTTARTLEQIQFPESINSTHENEFKLARWRVGSGPEPGRNPEDARQKRATGFTAFHAADVSVLRSEIQSLQTGAQDLRHGQQDGRTTDSECGASRGASL